MITGGTATSESAASKSIRALSVMGVAISIVFLFFYFSNWIGDYFFC
jgi:hypothetical protein